MLKDCRDYQSVKDTLQSLPETLDDTYSRILRNLPKPHVRNAKRLLQFLAFSERPLRIEEAVDVLAVDSTAKPRFDEKDRMPEPEEIAEYCASLVIVTGKPANREIQLVHFSVQTYLVSDNVQQTFAEDLREPTARAAVAETCLAYLLELDDSQPIKLLCSLRPFAKYAARYWAGNAARGSEGSVHRLAMELFTNQHKYRIWWLLYASHEPRTKYEWDEEPSTLYYASLIGFKSCVKEILREGVKVNAQGGPYGSALQAASERGHINIVRLLLEHEADVNAQGGYSGSALQAASAGGHIDIVRLLLEYEADVNAQGGPYGSALQAASEKGYIDIVRLLLEHEADVNAQGGRSGSALQAASENGHLDIVRLLLEHEANVNAQGGRSGSALQAASEGGHLDIVRLLQEQEEEEEKVEEEEADGRRVP